MAMIKNIIENTSLKVNWQGEIAAIQPRTRVWRYLTDNRTHYHIGYNLFIAGVSSVMDQSHANFTKWVDRVQFHTKIGGQRLMMDAWRGFVLKVEMKTNKNI